MIIHRDCGKVEPTRRPGRKVKEQKKNNEPKFWERTKIFALSLAGDNFAAPEVVGIDFLVSGLQGQLLRHLAKVGPMFPCNKGHEAKNNCGDWDFSHSGLEARLPAFQLPMFSKCDALPKGDLWEMLFFSGIYFAIFSSKDIQRQGRCLSCESVMDSNDFSP